MKMRGNRLPPIDTEHMKLLHEEAIDQLEMMITTLEAANQATDSTRDTLDQISINHWDAYMDVIHSICMHDEVMNATLKKQGMLMRESDSEFSERQFGVSRLLLIALLLGLIRRHRRFNRFYSYRANPMHEYLQQTMIMEREHIAVLIATIQDAM